MEALDIFDKYPEILQQVDTDYQDAKIYVDNLTADTQVAILHYLLHHVHFDETVPTQLETIATRQQDTGMEEDDAASANSDDDELCTKVVTRVPKRKRKLDPLKVTKTQNWEKLHLFISQDTFSDIVLNQQKAVGIIDGDIRTRYSRAFYHNCKNSPGFEGLYDLLHERLECLALPVMRVRSDVSETGIDASVVREAKKAKTSHKRK